MSTDVLSIRIPTDVKERLDELEWAYGLATHAEEVRLGKEPTRPLDEFADELGHTLST